MIIEGNHIKAEEGLFLRRKSDSFVAGTDLSLGYTYYLDGKKLPAPIQELPEHYEEVTQETIDADKERLYPVKVEQYIREKYSLSDELAIQRQRDTKHGDFLDYYLYCEDCKARAKSVLSIY